MKWVHGVLLAVVGLGIAARADATTIIALPEAELVRESDAIVVGTVIQTNTVIHENGVIATQAHVQVHQALRGPKANQVVIVEVPGGHLPNGLAAHTAGSPEMVGGDMIFGFLERAGTVFRPIGLSFGLLRVRQAKDGIFRVFREAQGLAMVDPTGTLVRHQTVELRDVPLTTFIARIRQHMDGIGVSLPDPGTVKP
ncbi:MAG: hypothetical protein A2289_16570 [Deltaproteobacteria bacterium RIFOXYA12_FULL_58_15]|nr:MAG: hypothetical protein A2289_16570 [Deltaproteobacteria bacterium RIFOXYA12_FULL_58_15]